MTRHCCERCGRPEPSLLFVNQTQRLICRQCEKAEKQEAKEQRQLTTRSIQNGTQTERIPD